MNRENKGGENFSPSYNPETHRLWHEYHPDLPDTLAERDYPDYSAYLIAEKAYLTKVYARMAGAANGIDCRYTPGTIFSPLVNDDNLNQSFLFPAQTGPARGAALLLHGLSDSPYFMRAIGKIFAQNGYHALGLRIPGHGTYPGALIGMEWQTWYRAVLFGAGFAKKLADATPGKRLILSGLSNGGALALHYTLNALMHPNQALPDMLVLFAPAAGISMLAGVAGFHRAVSWIPGGRALKWHEIGPEYDPFKYISFPYDAAQEAFLLIRRNRRIAKSIFQNSDQAIKMPKMVVFQSVADATVDTGSLIRFLCLAGNPETSLYLFDINRDYLPFVKKKFRDIQPEKIITYPGFNSCLYFITNQPYKEVDENNPGSGIYRIYKEDEDVKKEMVSGFLFPKKIFALSHVSLTIPENDPVYGKESVFGNLNLLGEKEVLFIPGAEGTRLRYNPFFFIVENAVQQAVES